MQIKISISHDDVKEAVCMWLLSKHKLAVKTVDLSQTLELDGSCFEAIVQSVDQVLFQSST